MPSYFPYRIKKASENPNSMWDYNVVPLELMEAQKQEGIYSEHDHNILPHTCTYISKVIEEGRVRYLCGIKLFASRPDLLASNEDTEDESHPASGERNVDGAKESRVSGALKLERVDEDNAFYSTHFKCQYIEELTGVSKREGVAEEETVLFPMCNCYTPRGGLAITHFDGAVKDSEAPGYSFLTGVARPPKSYDVQTENDEIDEDFIGPIPAYLTTHARDRFPHHPPSIGAVFFMLNARAVVTPCCWWRGKDVLIYKPEHFRVIDLAVAREYWERNTRDPQHSGRWGVSNIADYVFREGDYFFPNEGENYFKNILLGRNYDPTLPSCGNNQRIIYALDSAVTGDLTKERAPGDSNCTDIPWHFDSGDWFSPSNCSHPDCKVRYQWGAVCNGGGAYGLADGRACPYFENPLVGPESESERLFTLNRMYPGDSITGGALLELMWLCKGGAPWTQEEWDSTWRVPYIWTTLPFNPKVNMTEIVRSPDGGNIVRLDDEVKEYQVYAVKTSINLTTGVAEQQPARLLPGGSVTHFNRKPDTSRLSPGDQIPDLPTLIEEVQMSPIPQLNIVWPVSDFSLLSVSVDRSEDYMEKIRQMKSEPYRQLVWGPDSKNVMVMGYGSGGKYDQGVYCINTAMLVGPWAKKKDKLISKLTSSDLLSKQTQGLLKQLWKDLLGSHVAGQERILDGMDMQRVSLDARGLFVFKSIPLNLLFRENTILVFGFNSESVIGATYTVIKPIFKRAHLYQSGSTLMTGWKAVWNGRPSIFLDETELEAISGDSYEESKGKTIDVSVDENTTSTQVFSYSDTDSLSTQLDTLYTNLNDLNNQYASVEDPIVQDRLAGQITSKTTTIKTIEEQLKVSLSERAYGAVSSIITSIDQELVSLDGAIESLKAEKKQLELKQREASTNQLTSLSDYYSDLVKEVKFNLSSLEQQRESLTTDDDTEEESEESEAWEFPSCIPINRDSGDEDTCDGGYFLKDYPDPCGNPSLGLDTQSKKLYAPFLNSDRQYHRSIDKFTRTTVPGIPESAPPKVEVPSDSGISTWKYFEIDRGDVEDPIRPHWTYAPKGVKRAVVYTTQSLEADSSAVRGVKFTESIGRWYTLSSCSSMIVLVLNPELANLHNEFMIFSLTAEVEYQWKSADGSKETLTRQIKFAPFNYTQVNRDFPGYSSGKTVEEIGTFTKYGVEHKKISVSENIEVLERAEGNRHPWIFFAVACTEGSDVQPWSSYNGLWAPEGDLSFTTLPQKKEQVQLYIEYAFIGELYDQDDRKFLDWDEEEDTHKTRFLFNHPKAGTVRSVFTLGEGEVGAEDDSESGGIVDGFKRVPIGSSASTALWPYARTACRDYEIHYIWRDNHKNTQTTESFFMGRREPRQCGGASRRYTSYTHGDHDLGTVFKPKITWGHWEGGWMDRNWHEDEVGYTWETGQSQGAGDPTDSFPSYGGESYTPGNAAGPLYYPYTRSEPHSKYIPTHRIFIWDFLAQYRNKPEGKKYFGGFRFMAPNICYLGPTVERKSKWELHYEYNPKTKTDYLGRSRTRGPVFQLEYEDYEEKKPKIVFLRPYAARNHSSRGSTWTYYASASTTADENWDSNTLESVIVETARVADNPDSLSISVWKAICRSLYLAWAGGDDSAYADLVEQQNWGLERGWIVLFEDGLSFPGEETQPPEDSPSSNESRRAYLEERITFYENWIAKLEQEKAGLDSTRDYFRIQEIDKSIEEHTAIKDALSSELESLGEDESGLGDSGSTDDSEEVPTVPSNKVDEAIDMVTGCHKAVVEAIDQRGSFFFDNTYMPNSVSNSSWESDMQREAEGIKEKLKKSSHRVYWYEQKSFGVNVPWSPYDSPPLFGNTGREMYMVELCTVGSVISWLPTSDDSLDATQGKGNVPSWWTGRDPVGDPVELVTLLPPPNECTRAITPLSSEPHNPFYGYIITSDPFSENLPSYDREVKSHDIRIVTKHDTDHYGESGYRSDIGRLTLTLTPDSSVNNIKVYGNSPATRESSYTSLTTPVIGGDPSVASQPNQGDVDYDKSLPSNSMWGKDIRGLAIESGQTVFVGQTYPGFESPYTHGKVFISYKKLRGATIHWAWPKYNRDVVTRGQSLVKWFVDLPDLNSEEKNKPQTSQEVGKLEALANLQCAPYSQKHPVADDGREVSLGPLLKRVDTETGDIIYADKTYYAIIVESEREHGGLTRPPLIWAQQIDNPALAREIKNFQRPYGDSVAHKVNQDGSLTPVDLGSETTGKGTTFSTGFLTIKPTRNFSPGGNFLTSSEANTAGRYPAFVVDDLPYRYIGKVFSHKDYTEQDLSRFKVTKVKNRYGYNNHVVAVDFTLPRVNCDVLYIELILNDYFREGGGISDLFVNRNDAASFRLDIEGKPLPGSPHTDGNYSQIYKLSLPVDAKKMENNKLYYDLNFGLVQQFKITFSWHVRCNEADFDEGIWKGEELHYDPETEKWSVVEENKTYLSELLDKISLGVLLPGKCAEVVSIEEAPFIVSAGGTSKKEGSSYHFYTEGDPEWYKCQWEEPAKSVERTWDQKNLYLGGSARGDKQTDQWAQTGYEKMIDSFRDAGLNYNKQPESKTFPNSCVELPELPQSRLKIEAWEKYIEQDDEDRDWTWGGIWTTRVAGPEWRTDDPRPSRDFIWWPAPHYYSGRIVMKGRAWFFGDQYKDEAKVMEEKRQVEEDDEFNQEAHKNELSAYDNLIRNIQEFEAYRGQVRTSSRIKKQTTDTAARRRKEAATQRSFDRIYERSQGGGTPMYGMPAPYMAPKNKNYNVNLNRAYSFLDEVGLGPEKASWESVQHKEESVQKQLYEMALELKKDLDGEEIKATAIIPYYEWRSLMELMDSEWYERNNTAEIEPLTIEDLEKLKDEKCAFKWKTWNWDEVSAFTFREEYTHAYKPTEGGDLSKSGLLRRCGNKWIIFDKQRPLKTSLEAASDSLESSLTTLAEEKAMARSTQTQDDIQSAIGEVSSALTQIDDIDSVFSELGQSLLTHYLDEMVKGSYRWDVAKSYSKNPDLISELESARNEILKSGGYLDQFDDMIDTIENINVSSRAVNKALLEVTTYIESAKEGLQSWVPQLNTVAQKMDYYKNATADLKEHTRTLITSLGLLIHSTTTKVGTISCHSSADPDPKGTCDPEGYPQKWSWDPNRDVSTDWPTGVSDDGGNTLRRPDPWWRY